MKTTASVLVKIKIVECGGTWGPDATVEQVTKQAADSARGIVNNIFGKSANINMVGNPAVTLVVMEPEVE